MKPTFLDEVEELNKLNSTPENIDFPECRGMTFREFWNWLPNKLDYYDYEEELEQVMEESKYLWVKKSAGLGVTEWMIRRIAWYCLKDDVWKNEQVDINVIIIVGPRIDLAVELMHRLKNLFNKEFKTKETLCVLNGNRIMVFPSHHVATAHGLNPKIVFIDEGDLFPPGQQDLVREVAERYIAKSNPHIVFVSTPYLPGGLYEKIEKEENSIYTKKIMLYDRGLGKVYTPEGIEIAMKSPSFEREYNGKYGYGEGNIFPFIDMVVSTYDLKLGQGEKGLYVDPAFGSSMFAVLGLEKLDGILYVKEATEYARPSSIAMYDIVEEKAKRFGNHCIVDAAHPDFIKNLNERGVSSYPLSFGKKIGSDADEGKKQSQISLMTSKASQLVKEKGVFIHPIFRDLISQLRAVKFNDKGNPDKTQLTFDLGDAFLMGCWDMQVRDNTSVTIRDNKIIDFEAPRKSSLILKTETFE